METNHVSDLRARWQQKWRRRGVVVRSAVVVIPWTVIAVGCFFLAAVDHSEATCALAVGGDSPVGWLASSWRGRPVGAARPIALASESESELESRVALTPWRVSLVRERVDPRGDPGAGRPRAGGASAWLSWLATDHTSVRWSVELALSAGRSGQRRQRHSPARVGGAVRADAWRVPAGAAPRVRTLRRGFDWWGRWA